MLKHNLQISPTPTMYRYPVIHIYGQVSSGHKAHYLRSVSSSFLSDSYFISNEDFFFIQPMGITFDYHEKVHDEKKR